MNPDRSESPMAIDGASQDLDEEEMIHNGPGPGIIAAAHQQQQRAVVDPSLARNRSPTPPRALYRSTTGKGVAFTDEDTAFLVKFMDYRKYVPPIPLYFGFLWAYTVNSQVARQIGHGCFLERCCYQGVFGPCALMHPTNEVSLPHRHRTTRVRRG